MIYRFCVRVWLLVSLSLVSSLGVAAPVSFAFSSVPLVDFAQFTYRDLLKRDYVLSAELVGLNKKVSISVKALDESKLVPFVDQVLQSQGIRSIERGGVFFLESVLSAPAEVAPADPVPVPGAGRAPGESVAELVPDEFKVIKAMNRSVEFLVAAVNAVAGSPVARVAGGSRLALSAPKKRLDAFVGLVEQLDVAADVVEVSASFVEVTTNDAGGSGLSLVSTTLTRKAGLSVVPAQGEAVLFAGGYELALKALASDGRFKQVSNSRVVGDDAERLLLSVGDETPTIGSSSQDNRGNPVQNVVYRASGVILDVLPRVLGSGRLSLLVDGQVSAFQATTTGVSGSPTLVKRQVRTSVSLADGQVLVIGGLNDSKASDGSAGFSFLPASWRTRSGQNSKTDLVLILSARVLAQK